ncbi:MAG: class I SAM-dependent methyltransferase [Chloroflexi bacterium]|nr:class I SAM-dependent methyltransferase [Chloroflexota bacterium]MDA1271602.1 class I SAM-dependent methyltransferase [Chloroflexota bacterium]
MTLELDVSTAVDTGLRCQVCNRPGIERLLDLGYQPLCNDFLPSAEAPLPSTFYPLCVYFCKRCSLAQLGYVMPTESTFGEQYTYLTGSSKTLVDYYTALAQQYAAQFDLSPGDVVVEMGSNDGTFLKALQAYGVTVLGVEGSPQAASLAAEASVPTIDRFFGAGSARLIKEQLPPGSKIKLIIAMNVLAHTDNIGEFLDELRGLMDEDSVFINSCHWLIELIRNFEFDTIYHEHLRYFTMHSLAQVLEQHGLFVFDAEITDFYGGSILNYAKISREPPSERLADVLAQEDEVDVPQSLIEMKNTLVRNKSRLLSLLVDLKADGKRVIGVGAPMKASTLLNFYGITPDLMDYISEVNELKVGTVVPGVRIPVIHEDRVFEDAPDYAMILSWNMASHIMRNYRAMGYKGKFIIPVPEPEVID